MSRKLRDRNTIIIGGMGFLGSNLAIRLVQEGARVTIIDSMLPQYGGNLTNIEPVRDRLRVNFSDIRERHGLTYLVKDADFIFSLAGQTSHIDSMNDPFTDLEINCQSQLSLLEICRHHNPNAVIVYTSTRQLYGRPQYLPVDENHPTIPVDVNGINQLAAEQYYTLYSTVYGMHCVSLRLTNTYGPRQHVRGNNQGFVGIFLRQAIDGDTIRIFGNGQQIRDFSYVDDVVDALIRAAQYRELAGGVFNLGSPDRHSILEFVSQLHALCDFEHEVVPFPPNHEVIDIGDYFADYERFSSATGWRPQVRLTDGLRVTVDYFRERREDYW